MSTEERVTSVEEVFHNGALTNALKIMDGKFGGAFYIRYIFDTGRGCGWLQLLVEYPTGLIRTQLLCKNVCKASSYDEDGLGEVEGISYAHHPNGKMEIYKPHIKDSQRSGFYDIMRVCERPDMPIPLSALWQRIVENYEQIPIVELSVKSSLQDVYNALREYGEDLLLSDITRMGKGYVLLTKEEVEEIVTEMGYSLKEVRTEFQLRGLLETDKNPGSHQKSKKIDNKNCRFYAIKTELQNNNSGACKVLKDVGFTEKTPPTEESAQIEKLKGELAKMKKERDKMAQIVCERVPDLTQEEIMTKLL